MRWLKTLQIKHLSKRFSEQADLWPISTHHDKGTYHVLNARPAPGKTRIPGYCIASVHVRLQKVVPTFCTKSFPAPPHALTPFTGQQKRRPGVSRPSAWATDSQGRASRSGRPHVARR